MYAVDYVNGEVITYTSIHNENNFLRVICILLKTEQIM